MVDAARGTKVGAGAHLGSILLPGTHTSAARTPPPRRPHQTISAGERSARAQASAELSQKFGPRYFSPEPIKTVSDELVSKRMLCLGYGSKSVGRRPRSGSPKKHLTSDGPSPPRAASTTTYAPCRTGCHVDPTRASLWAREVPSNASRIRPDPPRVSSSARAHLVPIPRVLQGGRGVKIYFGDCRRHG